MPAASALLADWGAEVIKIEHVERGDAMRGLASSGVVAIRHRRARAARALEPRQAEPRARPHVRRRSRHPLPSSPRRPTCSSRTSSRACARSCTSSVDDIRAHNPQHHLRARHGSGRARARRRQGLVRLARVLVPLRHRARRQAPRVRPRARPAGPRLRRLDRRDDDRRRDHGRALPPRAHRRGDHRRRVAARHRAVGDGPGGRAVAADGHPDDGAAAPTGSGPTRSSATT